MEEPPQYKKENNNNNNKNPQPTLRNLLPFVKKTKIKN